MTIKAKHDPKLPKLRVFFNVYPLTSQPQNHKKTDGSTKNNHGCGWKAEFS
jgi:hypothetical protein